VAKKKKKKDQAEVVAEEQIEEVEAEIVEQAEGEEPTEERDELEIARDELEKAQAQAAEYLDGWQRTRAEFSNYKKRQESDRAQMMAFASAAVLRKLLPVVDDFERAMATPPAESDCTTWFEGISLIKQKLNALVESEGVRPVETEGQAFDPRHHEAVTYEEAEGYEDGQIIAEVQRGYVLGERVLRPALVRVAKAPVPIPEAESDAVEEIERDSDTTETKE
jgi:molecular chaperone GrpE